jgi:hypothetical protein
MIVSYTGFLLQLNLKYLATARRICYMIVVSSEGLPLLRGLMTPDIELSLLGSSD